MENTSEESSGNERKDHVPFILEQLSKEPKELPTLTTKKDVPLLEAIYMPALDYAKIEGYHPHKWDAKASMAA